MKKTLRAVHIAIHGSRNRNAGDTLLVDYSRKELEAAADDRGIGIRWAKRQLWQETTRRDVDEWNRNYDVVVVGGGGLFLRDQAGSDPTTSGWQWNCSASLLEELKAPLAVYGVGYNRFRRQEDFPPVFTDHLRTLARTARFFGLRNSGSIRRLRPYVGHDADLTLHFCPTTLLHQLAPAGSSRSGRPPLRAGINFASDRPDLRYPGGQEPVLDALAGTARLLSARGFQVVLLCHKENDAVLGRAVETAGIPHEVAMLHTASPGTILETYRSLRLVVGMRGHAQLIPFGLRVPIISLISHDKLAYFLEDLERPAWGVDVDEPGFHERLLDVVSHALEDLDRLHQDVAELQEGLYVHNRRNDERLIGVLM